MFESIFDDLEHALPGLLAVAIVAEDGIEVESRVRAELPLDVMNAELNGVLRTLNRFQKEQDLGTMREVVIRTEKQNVLLVALSEGLFALVVTDPSESTGRVRYEVQRRIHLMTELLT